MAEGSGTGELGEQSFDAVVFAGGGSRCLWQVGFWDVAAPALGLAPREVAAVSAGSTMATMIFAGVTERTLERFAGMVGDNEKNAYPENLLRKGEPVFPHYQMYREAILADLDDDALGRLQAGPPLQVMISRPPAWCGPRLGTLLGFACYELEKRVAPQVHPVLAKRVGFAPEVVDATRCETPEALADLLIASSCTPPFTPVQRYRGGTALDGGLVDNVPVSALSDPTARTLVLLTRRYAQLPATPNRVYVQPSEPVPISKWDYTNPEGLRAARDLGRRDAEAFVAQQRAQA